MLAKRLAIIVMLNEGCSIYRISDTLKVSSSTADRINDNLEKGSYNKILDLFKKNRSNYLAFLGVIESILTVGGLMPSKAGLDRYRH